MKRWRPVAVAAGSRTDIIARWRPHTRLSGHRARLAEAATWTASGQNELRHLRERDVRGFRRGRARSRRGARDTINE